MECEQRYDWSVLDLIFDGLLCVERAGRIVRWNSAAENLTGFYRTEVLGAKCTSELLMHRGTREDDICNGSPILDTLEDGRVREGNVCLANRFGHMISVRIRTSRLYDLSGRIIGAAEIFSRMSIDQQNMADRISELERMAMVDPLLGIPNRRLLEMVLEARFSAWERHRRSFGVIMMDLDRFKCINDTYGHLQGDKALKAVAHALTQSVRAFDIVGRWGGEEFLAIVDDTKGDGIQEIAERFRKSVKKLVIGDDLAPFQLTLSAGATVIKNRDIIESLLCRADGKVYEVKGRGGDGVSSDDSGKFTSFISISPDDPDITPFRTL